MKSSRTKSSDFLSDECMLCWKADSKEPDTSAEYVTFLDIFIQLWLLLLNFPVFVFALIWLQLPADDLPHAFLH